VSHHDSVELDLTMQVTFPYSEWRSLLGEISNT
jgi:hypothetical protein